MSGLHYRAFISYSHQDETWALWLQAALESYRVPRHLVGTNGAFGPIPARLRPIFRDREDLSSAADLTEKIRGELAASETLIVICSPAAADSHWVDLEIRHFRELGRGQRILALVVGGDPQSTQPGEACFPPALREPVAGRVTEPLAADARRYADGRLLARLKLVAGILGIRLDELRRRDAQRRRRTILATVAGGLMVGVLTGWLAYSAATTRRAAELQRLQTEELLGFMLGDLKRLDPILGLEVVMPADAATRQDLELLGLRVLDVDELLARALEWREEGIDLHGRGHLAEAMQAFQQSRAALIELHQREPGSRRARFELGQAEFWVGYVHYDKGELDAAEASFMRYGAITRRLINAEPNDAALAMELAYSLTNLGALELKRSRPDTSRALQLFQSAIQYEQVALVLDPANDGYRRDMANSLAFLADAWLERCDLGKAYQFRLQNVELLRELAGREPGNGALRQQLAYALTGLARVYAEMALVAQAVDELRESRRLFAQGAGDEPDNRSLKWQLLMRSKDILWHEFLLGTARDPWSRARALTEATDELLAEGLALEFSAAVEQGEIGINHSILARAEGRQADANRVLDQALDRLAGLVRQNPDHRDGLYQLARGVYYHWTARGFLPDPAIATLIDGYLGESDDLGSCSRYSLAARLAVMRSDLDTARSLTRHLLSRGYFEPEFVAFCKQHELCG